MFESDWSSSETRHFSEPYDRVFRAVCDAAVAEKMTIRSAEPESGHIYATTGISIWSAGDGVGVTLWGPESGGVEVKIASSLRYWLGFSFRPLANVMRLFRRIDSLLAGPQGL
ncbi:hypothetical protein AB4Z42_27140 [Mycobacterium sp. 2YAF39]|uniref:hypothetical protein n=1 Tax=Mycobacterium sp. 2YAF39 TaxID=3233033 RepID=UPI003F9B7128